MRLAWGLGYPSADAVLDSMTAPELDEWAMWFRLEPHESDKADVRHAIQAYLIARTMGGVKNKEVGDFIPTWGMNREPPKPQTVEEMVRVVMKANAMMGGTFH